MTQDKDTFFIFFLSIWVNRNEGWVSLNNSNSTSSLSSPALFCILPPYFAKTTNQTKPMAYMLPRDGWEHKISEYMDVASNNRDKTKTF